MGIGIEQDQVKLIIGNVFFVDASNDKRSQDFSKEMCENITNKIFSGTHLFMPGSNLTRFIVSFSDSEAPLQTNVYIKGSKKALSLTLGTESTSCTLSRHLSVSLWYIHL
jgi:hypothetical protein